MRPKTLVFVTAVLLVQLSLAFGQGVSSGSSGSTGSSALMIIHHGVAILVASCSKPQDTVHQITF